MSDKLMWFGSYSGVFKWIPVPDSGIDTSNIGYSEVIQFDDGSANVVGAPGSHRVFEMTWGVREATGASGLDIVKAFSQGVYGTGPFFFADPYNYHTNVLPPSWAAPYLASSHGYWPNPIPSVMPSTSSSGTPGYDQPQLGALWSGLTGSPVGDVLYIPIPPGFTLHIGFRAFNQNGRIDVGYWNGSSVINSVTPELFTSPNRFTNSYSGDTYSPGVALQLNPNSNTSLSILSGMAQLWENGYTPSYTGDWHPGQGNLGVKFDRSAIPETYVMADRYGNRTLKGLSATLVEVVP